MVTEANASFNAPKYVLYNIINCLGVANPEKSPSNSGDGFPKSAARGPCGRTRKRKGRNARRFPSRQPSRIRLWIRTPCNLHHLYFVRLRDRRALFGKAMGPIKAVGFQLIDANSVHAPLPPQTVNGRLPQKFDGVSGGRGTSQDLVSGMENAKSLR